MSQENVSHLSSYQRQGTLHAPRRVQSGEQHKSPFGDASSQQRKKFVAKGHDSQLQEAQQNKLRVEVLTINEGLIAGTIVRRDKYTVTVRLAKGTDAGKDLIIYKHAIESILIHRAEPAASGESEPASAGY